MSEWKPRRFWTSVGLRPADGGWQVALDDRVVNTPGKLPLVLRTELEEFSHLFTSPTESAGVVRLRATVVELTPAGESLRGQHVFVVRQPARSADAAGGVAALADASTRLASELADWVDAAAGR